MKPLLQFGTLHLHFIKQGISELEHIKIAAEHISVQLFIFLY